MNVEIRIILTVFIALFVIVCITALASKDVGKIQKYSVGIILSMGGALSVLGLINIVIEIWS